jgi:hypothetical protein
MKILVDGGLRPLTFREALSHTSELMNELKGKWFYLDGKGIEEAGVYAFDARGEFARPTAREHPNRMIQIYSGVHPLHFDIGSDDLTRFHSRRFVLSGNDTPDFHAPVVVGIMDATILEKGKEALARLKRGLPK